MGTFVDGASLSQMDAKSETDQHISRDFVSDRIDYIRTKADTSYDLTTEHIGNLTSLLQGLQTPSTDEIRVESPEIPGLDHSARPSLGRLELDTGMPENSSVKPDFKDIPKFSDISIPALSVAAPEFNIPDTPTMEKIKEPQEMPGINRIATPTRPSVTLPTPPTLDDIAIPSPPSITLPEFETEVPSMTLDDPTPFTWGEPAYNSDIWADLLAKVLDGIRNGGTGLDAAVEDEIYQRLLDRTRDENDRMYREAEDYFAARGFTMPPGAMAGRLNEINQQISRNNAVAAREITINQAELAQKNTHFIMDKGVQLEGMLRDFFTQSVNRLLEAEKITAQNSIDIYNAMVERYNARVRAYQSEAEVYKSRVQTALTQVDIFKQQVESARVASEVQQNHVEVYRSLLAAAEARMNLYKTDMEGARLEAEIEMTKLEQFKAETQAYVARLDGEKARFDLFGSQVQAEEGKARAYGERVRAYAVEVDAKNTRLDAELKQMQFVLEQNRQEIERYKAELEGYKAELETRSVETRGIVSGFQAETGAYQAETQAEASWYQVFNQNIQARIDEARFNMQKAVAQIEAEIRGYTSINELKVKGEEGIANIGAQLTASAWNAVNTSTSYGFSGSASESASFSYSQALSESHTFDETKTT